MRLMDKSSHLFRMMDSIEQDYHNFSTSSSHKLPTLSGTQAIRNVIENAQPITTSLSSLDAILGKTASLSSSAGGLQRGAVTELSGPPGVGKTTFALQVAVNAIYASSGDTCVTWIDTFSQLVSSRLRQLAERYHSLSETEITSSPPQAQKSQDDLLDQKFNYIQITSLPRLLALLLHPTADFPPAGTNLVVLDDLSSLVLSSLPRTTGPSSRSIAPTAPSTARDSAQAKRVFARRFQVLSSLAAGLQKFAVAKNVAVLMTSKVVVNLKAGQKAFLRPALTSQQWDNYLSTRVALYRGFWPDEALATQNSTDDEREDSVEFQKRSLRFARVVRLGGKLVSAPEVGFVIEEKGLREVRLPNQQSNAPLLPMATQPLPALEDVLDPDNEPIAERMEDPSDEDNDKDDVGQRDEASLETPLHMKRKAIEIDDSDDQLSDSESDMSLPPVSVQPDRFQPSSQLLHIGPEDDNENASEIPANKTHGRNPTSNRSDRVTRSRAQPDQADDEMLLDSYESKIPSFSEAAAEMSEPLTPSDDGRDSS